VNAAYWREVRGLLTSRQPALLYLVAFTFAGVAADLAVARAVDELPSFSSFARHEFDADVAWRGFAALGSASALAWVVVLLSIPVGAAVFAWLRACYLVALAHGRYQLRAPVPLLRQLAIYWGVYLVFELAMAGIALDVSVGLWAFLQIVTMPIWLYSEYAIVLDEIPFTTGVWRSIALFRARIRASFGLAFGVLLADLLLGGAFDHGFTDSTHVQPTYLVAWELALALLTFASDVLLLTLYRRTRFSAGGSAGSPAAPPTSTPSD
jgi:hypothetical protein